MSAAYPPYPTQAACHLAPDVVAAPVVNVQVNQSVQVGQRGGGCATVIAVTFLIFVVTKYWWVIAIAAVLALVVWAVTRR